MKHPAPAPVQTGMPTKKPTHDTPLYHVDVGFLENALSVFADPKAFEALSQSDDATLRAENVQKLKDALDFCNLLVLGDGIVGGNRRAGLEKSIETITASLADEAEAAHFKRLIGAVQPSDAEELRMEDESIRDTATFLPQTIRCATNIIDLYDLPKTPPTAHEQLLLEPLKTGKRLTEGQIEDIKAQHQRLTGRRFYAAIHRNEATFDQLRAWQTGRDISPHAVALLFTNFRLKFAENRMTLTDRLVLEFGGSSARITNDPAAVAYLPSMGRRDLTREFKHFVRWGTDQSETPTHSIDQALGEAILQDWAGLGSQMMLSERRSIPVIIGAVLSSKLLLTHRTPIQLLRACLAWREDKRAETQGLIEATRAFEAIPDEDKRKEAMPKLLADMLRHKDHKAYLNASLRRRMFSSWTDLGSATRMCVVFGKPIATVGTELLTDITAGTASHFAQRLSPKYRLATRLSEAARPVLAGVAPDLRHRLIDIFGGSVVDCRNPRLNPTPIQ